MSDEVGSQLHEHIARHRETILEHWVAHLAQSRTIPSHLISESERTRVCGDLLNLFATACTTGGVESIEGEPWEAVKSFLADLASKQMLAGFNPSQTAMMVLSLKYPLDRLIEQLDPSGKVINIDDRWQIESLIDELGLYTTDTFLQSRERLILRQREELLELSTPVIRLWRGILAVPLIGTLDSERTQVVMETLLHKIVQSEARIAIIDITGVPTVDTLVAQHLLKTVAAARLMGADCIVSGISPQIAQTIVQLGVEMGDVTTKATLEGAFHAALERLDMFVGTKRVDGESS